jgi:hypothetical protein
MLAFGSRTGKDLKTAATSCHIPSTSTFQYTGYNDVQVIV